MHLFARLPESWTGFCQTKLRHRALRAAHSLSTEFSGQKGTAQEKSISFMKKANQSTTTPAKGWRLQSNPLLLRMPRKGLLGMMARERADNITYAAAA